MKVKVFLSSVLMFKDRKNLNQILSFGIPFSINYILNDLNSTDNI